MRRGEAEDSQNTSKAQKYFVSVQNLADPRSCCIFEEAGFRLRFQLNAG
jgi:hypothetical protein